MHDAGFIHKDIKPDKFRIRDNRVVLIDFGLASNFKREGQHIQRDRFGFKGTPFYGSIRALQGYTLSRRDDIESVGYSLVHILNPLVKDVPWSQFDMADPNVLELLKCKTKYLGITGRDHTYTA